MQSEPRLARQRGRGCCAPFARNVGEAHSFELGKIVPVRVIPNTSASICRRLEAFPTRSPNTPHDRLTGIASRLLDSVTRTLHTSNAGCFRRSHLECCSVHVAAGKLPGRSAPALRSGSSCPLNGIQRSRKIAQPTGRARRPRTVRTYLEPADFSSTCFRLNVGGRSGLQSGGGPKPAA